MLHRLASFSSTVLRWGTVIISIVIHGHSSFAQSVPSNASTLDGKIMVGYQGWFICEGDGSELGWTHWTKDYRMKLGPTNVSIDLWPDVYEYSATELYNTDFKNSD